MKKLIFLLLFILPISFFSCHTQSKTTVDYKLKKLGYSPKEISELQSIANIFDSLLFNAFGYSDTTTPFLQYWASMIDLDRNEMFYERFDEEQIIKAFYRIKEMNVYSDIWIESPYYSGDHSKVSGKSLDYNINGRYIKFIKKTNKKYDKRPYYYNAILQWGGAIDPVARNCTQMDAYKHYDSNHDFQILTAVHYFNVIFNQFEWDKVIVIE